MNIFYHVKVDFLKYHLTILKVAKTFPSTKTSILFYLQCVHYKWGHSPIEHFHSVPGD